jgi:tRNA G10  N-methylase Trm11
MLPIPEETIDAVITDPPFGGNVNYGELADYWKYGKIKIV